jgi:hypothetical protein
MFATAALIPAGLLGVGFVAVALLRQMGRWYANPVVVVIALAAIPILVLAYTWRFCRVGLYVNERGLLVRYMTTTRRLDWSSVERIETARIRRGGGALYLAVMIVPTRGRRPLVAPVWCRVAVGRQIPGRPDGTGGGRYVRRIPVAAYQDMVEVVRAYHRRYLRLARAVREAEGNRVE